MIKALLFDMDGLIFDSEHVYKAAWQYAAKEQGLDLTDDVYQHFIGTQDPECERLLEAEFGDNLDLERYRSVCKQELRNQRAVGVVYKMGFDRLFATLKKHGLKCALVTSSHRPEVEHHFKHSDYLNQFDVIVTAEDIEHGKPQPDCYLRATQLLAIEPQHCLVLEDSNNGMQSGLDADCMAAMVPDILPPREDIAARATHIFDSLFDVIPLVESEHAPTC